MLNGIGAALTTQPVQSIIKKPGSVPGRGLDRNLQGKPYSVSEELKVIEHPRDKTGLENLS